VEDRERITIADGYCQCGCGGKTSICLVNNKRLGLVKGKPRRYLKGHGRRRLFNAERPLCECGCGMEVGLSKITEKGLNVIKGFPNRFIHGHNVKIQWVKFRQRSSKIQEEDGLCECGCGELAGFYKTNNVSRGEMKGQRRRFKEGHQLNQFRFGEKNPSWKGDTCSKRGGHSRARRKFPILGDCERCGRPGKVRHHKDRNTLNNDKGNIEILCKPCHLKEHRKKGLCHENK
jgi:hypothetical protein